MFHLEQYLNIMKNKMRLNEKAECAGHTFFTNSFFFSIIFLHAWITTFGSFSYLRE